MTGTEKYELLEYISACVSSMCLGPLSLVDAFTDVAELACSRALGHGVSRHDVLVAIMRGIVTALPEVRDA